jgi:hypothetical protein
VFFGNCAARHPDAAIWFYRLRGDDKEWQEKVYLAEVKDDRLVDGWPKADVPQLDEAEAAVQKSQCRELAGTDQWQEL